MKILDNLYWHIAQYPFLYRIQKEEETGDYLFMIGHDEDE
jgi:hypothetical protein